MENLNNENAYAILEAGETYQFAGYDWTVCEVDKEHHTAVIQSHGVTSGAWPGYVMQKFGGKANTIYGLDIDGEDISAYDDKMQALYDTINEVEDTSATYGKGLYIISKEKAGFVKWGQSGSGNYWQALKKAAENARLFGSPNYNAWLGTVNGSYYALYANRNGYVYNYNGQYGDFVVAPAFNLDLSKVKVVDDEIIKKAQPAPSSFEHDDNCQEHQLLGKTYKFAGYSWTACELINNGKTLVIQSHGVTHGAWPGFVMSQFGNGGYYSKSIDGEDISAYNNKMRLLYDAIKDVEDKSATYGKGLYLISKEKAGFTEWGKSGSGNYWQALKKAAENARSFGAASDGAWLGTVGSSSGAWCVSSGGYVYDNSNQGHGFVVAPAFNLDLSKVEVAGDEIVIKDNIKNDITDAKTTQQSVDVKIPGGILRAVECMDSDYPGIDICFIPDEKDNYNEPISLPRVLIEKPVDNEKLRAIIWNNENQEDPTFKIEF